MATDPAALFAGMKTDDRGLVPAVVQHAHTGQVLMVAYMNEAAFVATLQRRRATFFSRSREALWEKGESSGNTLDVVDVRLDCDADAVLVRAVPRGPTCHTGTTSCFFRHAGPPPAATAVDELPTDDGPSPDPAAMLSRVYGVILDRQAGRGITSAGGGSYVRRLLDAGPPKLREKILEEAGELADAIADEPDDRVAGEAADLFFHALVGLAHRGVPLDAVADVLAARFGTSGLDEKAARRP